MNRTLFSLAIVIFTVVLFIGLQTANAEFIGPTMDSDSFNWKYEMDADPAAQDLDTNSGYDWQFLTSGTPAISGGTLTMTQAGNDRWSTYRSAGLGDTQSGAPNAAHVWNNITDATGYTIEICLKSNGSGEYKDGSLYVLASDSITEKVAIVGIGDNIVWFNQSGIVDLDTNANDDKFHVFRIAEKANDGNKVYIWRDGVLIGDGIVPTNNVTGWRRTMFGDISPNAEGATEIDYYRITTGAYAPIPEPSTLALLATGLIGLLAYAWRKRK